MEINQRLLLLRRRNSRLEFEHGSWAREAVAGVETVVAAAVAVVAVVAAVAAVVVAVAAVVAAVVAVAAVARNVSF